MQQQKTSVLMTLSGSLMLVSALLMLVCKNYMISDLFGLSSVGLFISAASFRLAEKKQDEKKEDKDDEKTV